MANTRGSRAAFLRMGPKWDCKQRPKRPTIQCAHPSAEYWPAFLERPALPASMKEGLYGFGGFNGLRESSELASKRRTATVPTIFLLLTTKKSNAEWRSACLMPARSQ